MFNLLKKLFGKKHTTAPAPAPAVVEESSLNVTESLKKLRQDLDVKETPVANVAPVKETVKKEPKPKKTATTAKPKTTKAKTEKSKG